MDDKEKKIYETACKRSDETSAEVADFFGRGFIKGFVEGVQYALRFLHGGKKL